LINKHRAEAEDSSTPEIVAYQSFETDLKFDGQPTEDVINQQIMRNVVLLIIVDFLFSLIGG